MNCLSCGASNGDEALFCNFCGNSLPKKEEKKVVLEVRSGKTKWETASIFWMETKGATCWESAKLKLWAKAVGPQGEYSAGESELFDGGGSLFWRWIVIILFFWWVFVESEWGTYNNAKAVKDRAETAFKPLHIKLLQDGWEPLRVDVPWSRMEYRRPVRSK
jgi:hypothetical protein